MSESSQERKEKVKKKINEIKSNVETFISDIKVEDLKKSFTLMMKEAQKDFHKIVDQDLDKMKKKFQKEKVELEKKTKKFIDEQKKEINGLQSKLETLLKKTSKKAPAKAKAAKTTVKKAAKKAAKKVSRATKKTT
jgi:histone H1/5